MIVKFRDNNLYVTSWRSLLKMGVFLFLKINLSSVKTSNCYTVVFTLAIESVLQYEFLNCSLCAPYFE